jgi:hypothetical protein
MLQDIDKALLVFWGVECNLNSAASQKGPSDPLKLVIGEFAWNLASAWQAPS